MKRLILLLAVVTMVLSASAETAEKVESIFKKELETENPRVTYPYNFFVKAGGGFIIGKYDAGTGGAFNAAVGFQRTTNSHGLYWGLQLGFTMMRYEYVYHDDGSYYDDWSYSNDWSHYGKSTAVTYLTPMIGLKKDIGQDRLFDFHFGAGYQIPFGNCNNYSCNHYSRSDFLSGLCYELGFGVWFHNFLVELQYRGFCNMTGYYGAGDTLNNGAVLNLGYKF